MQLCYASQTLRNADRLAEEKYSLPGIVLMENAGRGAAEIISRRYPDAGDILILCGPGNNGGDGFVVARHLSLAGRTPRIIATLRPGKYKDDAAIAAGVAVRCGLEIFESQGIGDEKISEMIQASDLVIDALLGTGSAGAPRGEVARLLSLCKGAKIVSLDIPSGLNPDTGEAAEGTAEASLTVTFLAAKPGLAVAPGSLHSGTVEICHIGISQEAVISDSPALTGYDRTDIPSLAPVVARNAHKGDRGALLIVGGCDRYRGAPVLAAMGALLAGCGLVTLAVPECAANAAAVLLPEAILEPLPSEGGSIRFEGMEERIAAAADRCDAAVLGPGIGRSESAAKITDFFWRSWRKPLLVDADALHHLSDLAGNGDLPRRGDAVITPHAGEAAKLLNREPGFVTGKRLAACRELASRFSVALLKGSGTLLSDGSEARVIMEGSQALAVPGSGDALSGVVGALLAAGLPPLDAATLGALLHGKVGTDAQERGIPLLARDIANAINMEGE